MSDINELLNVDFTLEEVRKYTMKDNYIRQYNSTPRKENGYDEDKLLKASMLLVCKGITSQSYVKNYICITKDNYLLYTTVIEDSYGLEDKSKYFGLCNQFHSAKVGTLFPMLPDNIQSEIIATEWLAHNPKSLGEKVNQVLNTTSRCLEDKDKVIGAAEEMLVNAQHNMKKSTKEMFTKTWLGNKHFERVMKLMPWFKSCLEKGE